MRTSLSLLTAACIIITTAPSWAMQNNDQGNRHLMSHVKAPDGKIYSGPSESKIIHNVSAGRPPMQGVDPSTGKKNRSN